MTKYRYTEYEGRDSRLFNIVRRKAKYKVGDVVAITKYDGVWDNNAYENFVDEPCKATILQIQPWIGESVFYDVELERKGKKMFYAMVEEEDIYGNMSEACSALIASANCLINLTQKNIQSLEWQRDILTEEIAKRDKQINKAKEQIAEWQKIKEEAKC